MDKRIQECAVICILIGTFLLLAGGMFLYKGADKCIKTDLDKDGQEEVISKKLSKIAIKRDGEIIWKSDRRWKCDDVLVGDIDGDGQEEVLLLVWKLGSFDKYRPFWEKGPDLKITQHIFIYKWSENKKRIAPIWMSSELKPKVDSWNLNEDGTVSITTMNNEETEWKWENWGLQRIDKAPIII